MAQREKARPQEQADEAEGEQAPEQAQKDQDHWEVAAPADQEGSQQRLDHAEYHDAPDDQEYGPSGLAGGEQPDRRGHPDQDRSGRNKCQEKAEEPEQERAGNAGDPKADGRQNGLRQVRSDDAVHNALQGARRDMQQMGSTPACQPFQHGAKSRGGMLAVAIQEEGDQQADEDLHHTGADHGTKVQGPGTCSLDIGFQPGSRLNAARSQFRPELVQPRANKRQWRYPG